MDDRALQSPSVYGNHAPCRRVALGALRPWLKAIALGATVTLFLGNVGCVERRMTIRTNVDKQGGALVYVDKENLKVMKITLEVENLPAGFPIRHVNLSLDYGPARIGDNDYVLPLQAELRSSGDNRFQSKNDIEFRMYRKFGTDTSIKFDTPAPIPEGELKEQPLK